MSAASYRLLSPRLAVKGLAVAGGGVFLYLLWRSLHWPLIHDAALMHYIAWLISQGAVPYRDAFDMNMPGVYLIHLMVLTVGGAGDVAWRVFERGWLGATAGLMYLYGRPPGNRWSAAIGALLFAVHHLAGGATLAGQRDFLLCIFLLAGAHGVARSFESGGRRRPLLWAGLILGLGMMVKPLAGLFLAACAAAAALAAHRAGRSAVAAAGCLLGAALIMPALMFGWLAWDGGLGAFFEVLMAWTLPFYSKVGGASPLRILVSLNWGLLAGAALLGAARKGPRPFGMRRVLAVAGVGYGFLHFALQAKGYDYHLYPMAMFLCLLSGLALAPETGEARNGPARLRAHSGALAVVLVAVAIVVLGVRGVERLNLVWERQREERVNTVIRELPKFLPPGETVQILGAPAGHVLLRLGLRQPTRFFTDFQFYVWTTDPRIQALRSELMSGLDARPPAAIVAFPGRGGDGPYGRFADFPALAQFLDRRYTLAVEGNGYRIYTRRSPA